MSVKNKQNTDGFSVVKMLHEAEYFTKQGEGHKLHYEFFKNFNSKETRRAYRSDLKIFFQFFEKTFRTPLRHPKQVERFHLVAYKDFLLEFGGIDDCPASPKTIGRKLGAINSYFKFFVERDVIKFNPCDGIRRPKQVVKTETNALSDEQVRELLNSLKGTTLTQSLYRALLYMLFGTGIRVSELINLRREDFGKLKGMKVIRFKSKGGKYRTLPIKHEVAKQVEHYLRFMTRVERTHKRSDPLFQPTQNRHTKELTKPLNRTTVMRILKKSCREVGIFDRVSPHSARATLISSLLEKGVDLYKVSLAAGHSNPKTTKHYDKRDKKLEDSALLEVDYF